MPQNMMNRPLKAKMVLEGVDQRMIYTKLGRSHHYMSRRMSGLEPFNVHDMLVMKKELRITDKEEFLNLFFPGERWDA